MKDVVVGVDLGGTKTAAAIVSSQGEIGQVRSVPTPAQEGPNAVLDTAAALVRDSVYSGGGPNVAGQHEHASLARVRLGGVGVGAAGVVDTSAGRIVSSTDALPQWAGTDVRGGLAMRLADMLSEREVTVENDVDAHAAGESWRGGAAGLDSVLMVTVGTGVGASFVLNGRPLRGAHHVAGEMGHLPSPEAVGARCGCGRMGHLEAIASGPGLRRHYLSQGGDGGSSDARAIYARAAAGEELAFKCLETAARAMGRAIAGVAMVVDPAAVMVGGGLSQAGPLWWDPMITALRAEIIEPLADIPVRLSKLGPAAAILGAARTVHLARSSPTYSLP